MHYHYQERTLLHMQADLIDTKVELTVNKTIDQVIAQIIDLKQEMHQEMGKLRHDMQQEINGLRCEMHQEISGLRNEMQQHFSQVEGRLSSVETALGIRNQIRSEMCTRSFDYAFKAGWLILGISIAYLFTYFSTIIH